MKKAAIVILLMTAALIQAANTPDQKLSPLLLERISAAEDSDLYRVWIYFTDKDNRSTAQSTITFTSRALHRRHNIPIDQYDLPVRTTYIEAVRQAGGRNVRPSRWLNAVSTELTAEGINLLTSKPFIRKIDPIMTLARPLPLIPKAPETHALADSADYGPSYTQNHMLSVDLLHQISVTGQDGTVKLNGSGVMIAFFDTGFQTDHETFDSMTISHTWDFINNDSTVDDDMPSVSQLEHGTATLSACGGYTPGSLIGPAYGAEYILAKTEIVSQEIRVEEDNWVLAAEWADSLGADIISSSLGYNRWYLYSDMDGNTAVTTIAADIAASRGILVVISAGNEGSSSWHYIVSPADGDSVIAVGAVNADGVTTAFSSYGPTYDGRVKPEMLAMGENTRCALPFGTYGYRSGTSLAAPLIAGSAALMIQNDTTLHGDPMETRRRLIESANRYPVPDPNHHSGYGIPDLIKAAGLGLNITRLPSIAITVGDTAYVTVTPTPRIVDAIHYEPLDFPENIAFIEISGDSAVIRIIGDRLQEGGQTYCFSAATPYVIDTVRLTVITSARSAPFYVGPNPFSTTLTFYFTNQEPTEYTIEIYTLAGEMVLEHTGTENPFVWDGRNGRAENVASGVYIIRIIADGIEEKLKVMKL